MRFLVTSDWQVSASNLPKCETVLNQILEHVPKVHAVVHLGDVKHVLNPVDLRVINFIAEATRRITEHIPFYVLLGNHDRASVHDASADLGPVLRAAGATVFSDVGLFDLPGGWFFWHVPFFRDQDRTMEAFSEKPPNPEKTILLFHETVDGVRLNAAQKATKGVKLPPHDWYKLALGGHVHMPQLISRHAYYVGSPFAQDWGEANQAKGFYLLDTRNVQKIKFVPSLVPGYYDPTLPGFSQPTEGSYVRSKITIKKGESAAARIAEETARLQARFPLATPVVVPQAASSQIDVDSDVGDPDDQKLVDEYLRDGC